MKFEPFSFSRFIRMFLVALFVTFIFSFLPVSSKPQKKRKTSESYEDYPDFLSSEEEVPLHPHHEPKFTYKV